MTDTEVKLCKHGDGKPVHCKEECQAHYRQTARRARGLKAPGPRPDAAKPFSRYNTVTSHHRAHDRCSNGHLWVEGSYTTRTDGKKVCVLCIEERKGTMCPAGLHLRSEHENAYGQCKPCAAVRQHIYRLKSKYGLTVEQVEAMLAAQEYRCGICGDDLDLESHNDVCIDHNHSHCGPDKACEKCLREILCATAISYWATPRMTSTSSVCHRLPSAVRS